MDEGNWVPISKGLLKYLPKDRKYTKLEAAYSLQVDYDQNSTVTITGYSELWRWSKGKVIRFLTQLGIEIKYPETTTRKRNQRGLITIHKADQKRTNKRLIRLIDNKSLPDATDLKQNKNGLKTDLKRYTTKDNNTKTNKKTTDRGSIPTSEKEKTRGGGSVPDPAQAPSNSKHYSIKVGSFKETINDKCKMILDLRSNNGSIFNPFEAVQKAVNKKQHPEAIDKALGSMVGNWTSIDNPWGYFNSTIKSVSQHYNERDHIAESEAFKNIWIQDSNVKELIQRTGMSMVLS